MTFQMCPISSTYYQLQLPLLLLLLLLRQQLDNVNTVSPSSIGWLAEVTAIAIRVNHTHAVRVIN